jgi:hypothetical protein
MPLSITDAVPGAYVEEYFDETGAKLSVRRRGYIVKVEHPDGATFDASYAGKVFALFDRTKGMEPVKLKTLNLIKRADESSLQRLKQEQDNLDGDKIRSAIAPVSESPAKDRRTISQDKTGVDKNPRGMSPQEAEKLTK